MHKRDPPRAHPSPMENAECSLWGGTVISPGISTTNALRMRFASINARRSPVKVAKGPIYTTKTVYTIVAVPRKKRSVRLAEMVKNSIPQF